MLKLDASCFDSIPSKTIRKGSAAKDGHFGLTGEQVEDLCTVQQNSNMRSMDAVSKRQCILAVALLVQSMKVYSWMHWETTIGAFLLKWGLIEGCLLLILWHLQVPKLAVSLPVTACFAVSLLAVNWSIFAGLPWGLYIVRLKYITLPSTVEMAGGGEFDEGVDDIAGSPEQFLHGTICSTIHFKCDRHQEWQSFSWKLYRQNKTMVICSIKS